MDIEIEMKTETGEEGEEREEDREKEIDRQTGTALLQ